MLLNDKTINQKSFIYILLASLLYSADKVANTVGHYDVYRKNVDLQDRFDFMLIDPIKSHSQINIYRQDSNDLVRNLKNKGIKIDVAFIEILGNIADSTTF